MSVPVNELILLAVGLVAAGGVAGILAGIFGIGGGAVLVPVLYQLLVILGVDEAVRMHISVGTSLGIIIPTSIRSFMAHKARGAVDMELLKSWVIAVPLGVVLGSLVAAFVSAAVMKAIFAFFAILIAVRMLSGVDKLSLGDDLPGQPARSIIGVAIGLFSTLMGIGGGVFNNTFMTFFGRPIHQAVATSSGVGTLISIPGAIGFIWAGWGAAGLPPFSLGYINLLGVLLVIPVTIWTAPIGVKIAHAVSKRKLEVGFGIFLIVVAGRFFLSLL
ncbi:MAG TPA: sulfite exporter TauE/SafE family protein [Hyphomicrobiales bacterium]|nr:sulfite exporter TauE/SafE family protein [Kaistiaceae bacterium]HQF30246.1 sulfite exporter TauE/SafE family protein [Hyphomicrobiales bacterium]